VAAAVRFLFLALGPGLGVEPWSDSIDYHRLAAHLAAGRGFTLGPEEALYPSTFRPPLLPAVVAPFYAGFGPSYVIALLVQIALSSLIVPVGHALARAVAGPKVAFAAAVALAFWPTLVYFSAVLLTETLAALLTAVAVLLAIRLWREPGSATRAIALGAALGLAALTRPTALPLAAVLFVWVALTAQGRARARARATGLALAGLALAVLPWTLRNLAVTGEFVPVTSGGGTALHDSNNPVVAHDPRWRGGALSLRQIEPYASSFRGLDEVEIDRLARRMAIDWLSSNRDLWPRLAVWKLARFFRATSETPVTGLGMPAGSFGARLARLIDPLLWTYGILLPFFAFAALVALAHPRRPEAALALAVAVQASLAVIFWGSLRMRAPVEPLIVILGLMGVAAVWRRATRHRGERARPVRMHGR
jgi:4-amino-4-deoxy-L-arabinose transferase-like glycosyltransferase